MTRSPIELSWTAKKGGKGEIISTLCLYICWFDDFNVVVVWILWNVAVNEAVKSRRDRRWCVELIMHRVKIASPPLPTPSLARWKTQPLPLIWKKMKNWKLNFYIASPPSPCAFLARKKRNRFPSKKSWILSEWDNSFQTIWHIIIKALTKTQLLLISFIFWVKSELPFLKLLFFCQKLYITPSFDNVFPNILNFS